MGSSNRILVKLMPGVVLRAAGTRANIRPLHDEGGAAVTLDLAARPAWYLADLPDRAGPNAWDLAHAQVADQLGVDSSAVLFAEPDLPVCGEFQLKRQSESETNRRSAVASNTN